MPTAELDENSTAMVAVTASKRSLDESHAGARGHHSNFNETGIPNN
jgi:hypothetical protein